MKYSPFERVPFARERERATPSWWGSWDKFGVSISSFYHDCAVLRVDVLSIMNLVGGQCLHRLMGEGPDPASSFLFEGRANCSEKLAVDLVRCGIGCKGDDFVVCLGLRSEAPRGGFDMLL